MSPVDSLVRHISEQLGAAYSPGATAEVSSRSGSLYRVRFGEHLYALKLFKDELVCFFLAGPERIERSTAVLETAVLPLN